MRQAANLLSVSDGKWIDALHHASHDVYHLPAYSAIDAELRSGEAVAFLYIEGSTYLLIPLILRIIPRSDLLDAASPYGYPGPIGNADPSDGGFWCRAIDGLSRLLRERRVVAAFLRLHPLFRVPPESFSGPGTIVRNGQTVSIDLSLPEDQMWSAMRKSHRYEIAKARRSNLRIVWDDWDHLPGWTEIYYQNMARVDATGDYFFPLQHFVRLRDETGGSAHLVMAFLDDEMIAGQFVFETCGIVQTHLTAMRTDSRRLHPDKLLYDEVRRWAIERENRVHHLGGGFGGAQDGLFAYKAGFSDRRHDYFTWRIIVDEPGYTSLSRSVGIEVAESGGYFPAYRRPSINQHVRNA